MASPKKKEDVAHVAPESLPFQVAPEVPPTPVTPTISVKESCSNCKGGVLKEGLLFCHGQPPTAVYRQVIIGVGAVGEPVWPKMNPSDWCLAWQAKLH